MATQTTILSEVDLHKKHKEEEERLAENFAQKMTRHSVEANEVNNLLTQHAVSMQALRKRQQLERDKHKQNMQRRLQER